MLREIDSFYYVGVFGVCMSSTVTMLAEYYAGNVDVRFECDDWPNVWDNDLENQVHHEAQVELLELSPVDEWRDNFETAQEFSPPGMSLEPVVGDVVVHDDGSYDIEFDIEDASDVDWENYE